MLSLVITFRAGRWTRCRVGSLWCTI